MAKIRAIDEKLDAAGRAGNVVAVKLLLAKGAKPQADQGCKEWITAMDAAAKGNQASCVEAMAPWCDLERKGEQDWTPLHWAAEFGAPEAALALLAAG